MDEYRNFIIKYFPYCSLCTNTEMENLYRYICENNFTTDIYRKYLEPNKFHLTPQKLIFLNRYQVQLNKLLIYVPLNDGLGVNACMRYCTEQLLKFLYAICIDEGIDRINTIKYRFLKENLKSNIHLIGITDNEIDKLSSYYAKYSNEIHDKNNIIDNEVIYLKQVITGPNDYIKEVNNDLNKILEIYHNIMITVFEIHKNSLASFERIRLPQIVGKKRADKLIDLMIS